MHHEPIPSPEMNELFAAARAMEPEGPYEQPKAIPEPISRESSQLSQAGPTGNFPGGRLTKNDEGELTLEVGILKGKVVLNFGTPVASIGLEPKMCLKLANQLRCMANKIQHDQYEMAALMRREAKRSKR